MTGQNLWDQERANRRRSFLLVAGFVLFFAWVGFGGDLALYLGTRDLPAGQYHHLIPWIGIVVTGVAGMMAWTAWHKGAERVLWASGAREVVEPQGLEEKQLVNVVEEMAIAARLPRPQIWIVPDQDPNAFATGIDAGHAHIAVTEGLLHALNREELQGVVAHEFSHIRNLDVRLMTLLAAIVGATALIADGLGRYFRYGGRVGSSRGGKGNNPLAVVVLVLWLITLILAPIVTRLLALAVSRKREYLADATGAELTRNPAALASALEKLDGFTAPTRAIGKGAAHLCIVDPIGRAFNEAEGGVAELFGSHPPIKQRIVRLQGMAYMYAKQDGTPIAAPPVA
ncbi:MAG TPA: M48 family metallopeptidase [Gemmatimonadales bacterium]|nr:M48 family metallopeptidase [Gemmatimonadales bacterium]